MFLCFLFFVVSSHVYEDYGTGNLRAIRLAAKGPVGDNILLIGVGFGRYGELCEKISERVAHGMEG